MLQFFTKKNSVTFVILFPGSCAPRVHPGPGGDVCGRGERGECGVSHGEPRHQAGVRALELQQQGPWILSTIHVYNI